MLPISSCRARIPSSIKIDEIDPNPGMKPKLDETGAPFDVVGFSRFGVVYWALHIDAVNGPLIGPLEFGLQFRCLIRCPDRQAQGRHTSTSRGAALRSPIPDSRPDLITSRETVPRGDDVFGSLRLICSIN